MRDKNRNIPDMARPKQCRQVETAPSIAGFTPYGHHCKTAEESVEMRYDEFEAIRLLDHLGMQQAEASEAMKVSRPTLTRIYNTARQKIAKALVEGLPIILTGGNTDFEQHQLQKMEFKVLNQRIAIPTANGVLFPHFGRAPQVTFFTVVAGKVTDTEVLTAPEHAHGAMPRFMAQHNCTDVICGGLGGGAVELLNQLGIQVHGGAPELPVEQVVEQYLSGTIVYGDSACSHDGCDGHHHHHEEGHGCHGEGHGHGHGCHHDEE